jgi:hypothetical protein
MNGSACSVSFTFQPCAWAPVWNLEIDLLLHESLHRAIELKFVAWMEQSDIRGGDVCESVAPRISLALNPGY